MGQNGGLLPKGNSWRARTLEPLGQCPIRLPDWMNGQTGDRGQELQGSSSLELTVWEMGGNRT